MSQKEHRFGVSSARIIDRVTGKQVENICRIIYNDGEYEWRSEEVYLIEKYNMKVSDEFINHVLELSKPSIHADT